MPPDAVSVLLLLVPALVGIGCLAGAIALLRHKPDGGEERSPWVWVAVLPLFFVAFGIGACYAVAFGGGLSIGG